jgi:hypothetical protein
MVETGISPGKIIEIDTCAFSNASPNFATNSSDNSPSPKQASICLSDMCLVTTHAQFIKSLVSVQDLISPTITMEDHHHHHHHQHYDDNNDTTHADMQLSNETCFAPMSVCALYLDLALPAAAQASHDTHRYPVPYYYDRVFHLRGLQESDHQVPFEELCGVAVKRILVETRTYYPDMPCGPSSSSSNTLHILCLKSTEHNDSNGNDTEHNSNTEAIEASVGPNYNVTRLVFDQERELILGAIRIISCCSDVIIGWKLFHELSDYESSIAYMLRRLEFIDKNMKVSMGKMTHVANPICYLCERLVCDQGRGPYTRTSSEEANKFVCLPCIDLFDVLKNSKEYKKGPTLEAMLGRLDLSNQKQATTTTGRWTDPIQYMAAIHAIAQRDYLVLKSLITSSRRKCAIDAVWSRGKSLHIVNSILAGCKEYCHPESIRLEAQSQGLQLVMVCNEMNPKKHIPCELYELFYGKEAGPIYSGGNASGARYKGGLVLEVSQKLHAQEFVITVDANSLYASVPVNEQMCPSNVQVIKSDQLDSFRPFIKDGSCSAVAIDEKQQYFAVFCYRDATQELDCVVPKIMKRNIAYRSSYQRLKHRYQERLEQHRHQDEKMERQLAARIQTLEFLIADCKIDNNSFYGTLGALWNKYSNVLFSASITSRGRELLSHMTSTIEKRVYLCVEWVEAQDRHETNACMDLAVKCLYSDSVNDTSTSINEILKEHPSAIQIFRCCVISGDTDGFSLKPMMVYSHPHYASINFSLHKGPHMISRFSEAINAFVNDYLKKRFSFTNSTRACTQLAFKVESQSTVYLLHTKKCKVLREASLASTTSCVHKGMWYETSKCPPIIAEPMKQCMEKLIDLLYEYYKNKSDMPIDQNELEQKSDQALAAHESETALVRKMLLVTMHSMNSICTRIKSHALADRGVFWQRLYTLYTMSQRYTRTPPTTTTRLKSDQGLQQNYTTTTTTTSITTMHTSSASNNKNNSEIQEAVIYYNGHCLDQPPKQSGHLVEYVKVLRMDEKKTPRPIPFCAVCPPSKHYCYSSSYVLDAKYYLDMVKSNFESVFGSVFHKWSHEFAACMSIASSKGVFWFPNAGDL